MRSQATASNTLAGMQAWAGQSAKLATSASATDTVAALWDGAPAMLD